MSKVYEFRAAVIIKVTASNLTDAIAVAEAEAAEVEGELGSTVVFVQKNGHAEVSSERCYPA